MSPVYKELSANLTGAATLVQGAFGAVQEGASMATNAKAARQQLGLVALQLKDRAAEALDNVNLAQGDVAIAKAEDQIFVKQLDDVQKKIDDAKNQSFSFTDLLTDVGTISSTLIGLATGAGAIVSIPAGIKAFGLLIGSSDGGAISMSAAGLLEVLKNKEFKQDLSQIGDGITALVKNTGTVKNGIANFSKILDELSSASNSATQT